MASDRVTARLGCCAAFRGLGCRTFDDVLQRAIVLHKIEVRRGDWTQRHSVVTADGDGFEENLGENDRAAPIEIDAVGLHALHKSAEETEVGVCSCAERAGIDSGMHVGNVGADREVDRDRDAKFVC